ncbi:MAG: apolipoprotein N-acyltransferase [Gammaproteobacteria bacterium]
MFLSFPLFERSPKLGDAAAALLGLLMPLAFAPVGWFPLAVLMPAGLIALWEEITPRRCFWRGWLFGIGMFGAGVSWVYISIHTYGRAAVPVALLATLLLVAVLALFPALTGFLGSRLVPGHPWRRIGLVIPAAWILLEWVRGWLFTGFPWLDIGYSQIDSPVAGFAPLLGIYGVGALVMVSAGGLFLLVSSRGVVRWWTATLLIIVWLSGAWTSQFSWTESRGSPLQISIVQGNIPQEQKWLPALQQETVQRYLELTENHWDQDLVVWPETAIPLFYHEVKYGLIPELEAIARQTNTDLITGIPILELDQWGVYNTVMSLGESGGFYRKQHLVPFGEYIPMRRWLGDLLAFFTIPLGDFNRGSAHQPLLRAAGYPMGTSICYEIAFGNEIIRSLPAAAWLVNVSNDGWFGDSLAPHQHLEMARMRALETSRYLLRATNTGISALIDPKGRVVALAPQFEAAVVEGTIIPLAGATPYVRFGDWPVIIGAFFLFMGCVLLERWRGIRNV